MPTIYDEKDEIIKIPFPKKRFQVYLKKQKVSDPKKLTFAQKKKIFLTSISDFLKGKLSLDEMSAIALFLWSSLSGKEKTTSDLADALYYCAELNYYVRHITKKEGETNTFISFIIDVMEYYEKNKTLLTS